ncbi:MAG: immunity 49 family protein [Raineya sp.]|nr:immunity 49 family protein [Raineya sp.]
MSIFIENPYLIEHRASDDPFLTIEEIEYSTQSFEEFLQESKRGSRFLKVAQKYALEAINFLHLFTPENKPEILKYLGYVLDINLAFEKLLHQDSITLHLEGFEPIEVPQSEEDRKENTMNELFYWYYTLGFATLLRREESINYLKNIDVSTLEIPKSLHYGDIMFKFWKFYWLNDTEKALKIIKPAVELFNQEKVSLEEISPAVAKFMGCGNQSKIPKIYKGLALLWQYEYALLEAFAKEDEKLFNQALEKYLLNYQIYWASDSYQEGDPNYYDRQGHIVFKALFPCVFAKQKSMKIEVESDFIPRWLIEGDFSMNTQPEKEEITEMIIPILSPESLKLLSPTSPYKLPPEITQIEVNEEIKDKGQILTATLFSYYLENEQQKPYKVENIKIQLTSINKSKKLYTFENMEPFMVIWSEKAQHFPKNMKIIIKQENVKVVS